MLSGRAADCNERARSVVLHLRRAGRRPQDGHQPIQGPLFQELLIHRLAQGDREFGRQLISFTIFIGAGSVALFQSLGAKNPSNAILLVALLTPFWTFYCIISLLKGDAGAAFLFSLGIYGYFLMAMMVPAVSDFDIALGRTSAIQG